MANPAIEKLSKDLRNHRGGGATVTLDSVVEKTFITLGLLVLSALATWFYAARALASVTPAESFQKVLMATFATSLIACGLSFWISFKSKISPTLILIFAALEGVAIGGFSKVAALEVGSNEPVYGAIVGTFVAAAATLGVYRFTDIQVTNKMRRYTMIAMFSFIGVSFADLLLHLFGGGLGVNGFGATGALFSLVGVGIALMMLLIDFDAVEKAIAYGAPVEESWRLAFALTVTLVWIYVNLLKILSYLRR